GVVALPLALAFGVSSGIGAAAGLVTAGVAGVVAAVLGGSHHQVSGPTGAMAVVLAPVVATHGPGSVALATVPAVVVVLVAGVAGGVAAVLGGAHRRVAGRTGAMAVVLAPVVATHGPGSVALGTVLAGVVVLVAGVARLGRVVTYVPWPVVEGFTLGIACIIFLQQVPAAVGVPADPGHNTLVTALAALGTAASAGTLSPALWALGCVALVAVTMLLLPRLHPGIPASLVAVVLVTVLV